MKDNVKKETKSFNLIDDINEQADNFVDSLDNSLDLMTDGINNSLDTATEKLIDKNKKSRFIKILGIDLDKNK